MLKTVKNNFQFEFDKSRNLVKSQPYLVEADNVPAKDALIVFGTNLNFLMDARLFINKLRLETYLRVIFKKQRVYLFKKI